MSTKPIAKPVVELRTYEIDIPAGVQFSSEKRKIAAKGPAGHIERPFPAKRVDIKVEGNKISIKPKDKSADARMIAGAFNAHIRNMIAGAQKPYVYKLKVTYTHFPVTVTASGSEFVVQNFLGSKKHRKIKLFPGAKVSIQGDIITVESPDLELAGKTASSMEKCTRITNRDRRVFQDGIYITQKPK